LGTCARTASGLAAKCVAFPAESVGMRDQEMRLNDVSAGGAIRIATADRAGRPDLRLFAVANFRAHSSFLAANLTAALARFLRTHRRKLPFVFKQMQRH
jgi:pyridoxine/pyridoxamine 5'-phosphate oxidase